MRYLVLVAALALASCAQQTGVQVQPEQYAHIEKGKSTEADVVAALGKPTTVTESNGYRFLSYSGSRAEANAATFIPIVGLAAGTVKSQYTMVMFKFRDGVLEDIVSTRSGQ